MYLFRYRSRILYKKTNKTSKKCGLYSIFSIHHVQVVQCPCLYLPQAIRVPTKVGYSCQMDSGMNILHILTIIHLIMTKIHIVCYKNVYAVYWLVSLSDLCVNNNCPAVFFGKAKKLGYKK